MDREDRKDLIRRHEETVNRAHVVLSEHHRVCGLQEETPLEKEQKVAKKFATKHYDLRPDAEGSGWTVFDKSAGKPAIFEGLEQTGLLLFEARNVIELLESLRSRSKGGLFGQ